MITRRIAACLISLTLALGISSPAAASCARASEVRASSHAAGHEHHHSPARQHSSPTKAPCTSHDSNCCPASASCAGLSFVITRSDALRPQARTHTASFATVLVPLAPTLTVESPPPRA